MFILKIVGIAIGWFLAGTFINVLLYGSDITHYQHHPNYRLGKLLHIVLNIVAVILTIRVIF